MAVIIITGSASGFGLESALAFARNGDTVIATMRDVSGANRLQGRARAEHLELDVRQLDVLNSATFSKFADDIVADHGRIDVLINNAGIHRAGALEDVDENALRLVMETNCIGPLLLSRAILPVMRNQGSGLIIMMSSLSGLAGLPGDLPYAASKFALEGATEALRHEVDRWGIKVALVQAGLYETEIMSRNLNSPSALPSDYPDNSPYKKLIEWQLSNLRSRMPEALDPAHVAALFVAIANADDEYFRLRWPADPLSEKVLETMLAQDDAGRDRFLRSVAGSDWWSSGESGPDAESGDAK